MEELEQRIKAILKDGPRGFIALWSAVDKPSNSVRRTALDYTLTSMINAGLIVAQDGAYALAQQGSRNPLDEKDALIAQLRERITQLEELVTLQAVAIEAARKYANNTTSVNLFTLDVALAELEEHK